MKSPLTDETHVSYVDTGVFARWCGFPKVSTSSVPSATLE